MPTDLSPALTRAGRALTCALGLALAVPALTAAPALAASTAPTGGTAPTVVLSLTPAAPQKLDRLATHHASRPAARRTALATATPGDAQRARVTGWLAAHGWHVTATGPLTVTATAPAGGADATLADGHVPAALTGDVSAVVSSADGHRWHPQSLPGGTPPATFAAAYARPAVGLGAGATIATVQFSGWPALADPAHSDLAGWATAAGVGLPPITAIGVNGADPTAADGGGGDVEVALDQEALLATAPLAAQRVYVTTNGDAVGGVAVWDRILADVRDGVRITAVSTSWGACEQVFGSSEIRAIEQDLAALNALGVSVFAASGDSSAYDCPSGMLPAGQTSVDYPAASPGVVGVGGTDLTTGLDGFGEVAWGGTTVDHQPGDGSGGGVSSRFTRPAWQTGVAADLPARRVVPDIAAEADPSHGLAVLDAGHWYLVGGTSLAAPVQAGIYAATLAAAGHPAGTPVEVHAALYGAGADGFRDVTSGTNHAYAAGPGYDAVTGLGGAQWAALSPALLGQPVTPVADTTGTTSGATTGTGTTATATGTTATAPTGTTTDPTGTGTDPTGTGSTGTTGTGSTGTTGTTTGTTGGTGTTGTTGTTGGTGTTSGTGGTSSGTTGTTGGTTSGTGGTTGAAPTTTDPTAGGTASADTRRPVAIARIEGLRHGRIQLRWDGFDPAPSAGLAHYRVVLKIRRHGHVRTVWVRHPHDAGWLVRDAHRHTSYRLVVVATDRAGHHSARAVTRWHRP